MNKKTPLLERETTHTVLAIVCIVLYIALNLFFGFVFYHALPATPSLLERIAWIAATFAFASLVIVYFYEAVCGILKLIDMFHKKDKTIANECITESAHSASAPSGYSASASASATCNNGKTTRSVQD